MVGFGVEFFVLFSSWWLMDLTGKSDGEVCTWILNHEKRGETNSELYKSLLEERARRSSSGLKIENSLQHLIKSARQGIFTTYGHLAKASDVPWGRARHAMNGEHGHLDRLLDVCHVRGLPLLTALCVNQQGAETGRLSEDALRGFVNGAKRLGHSITSSDSVLQKCQQACFAWWKIQ